MRKWILGAIITCSFVMVSSMAFATGGNKGGGSSATAGAAAQSEIDFSPTISPVTNNFDNSTTTANANQQTNVGIDIDDTNVAQGGTGVGIGGQGGQGGHAQATVVQDFRNYSKVTNRQFPGAYGVAPPQPAQQFNPWNTPWNNLPIYSGGYESVDIELEVKIVAESGNFSATDLKPVKNVLVCGSKTVPATECPGKIIGNWAVTLDKDHNVAQAMDYIMHIARKNGANVVEVVNSFTRQKPTTNYWNVGFGGTATAVAGPEEKMAAAVGGGTGTGETTIVNEHMPTIAAYFRLFTNGDMPKARQTNEDKAKEESLNIEPKITQ